MFKANVTASYHIKIVAKASSFLELLESNAKAEWSEDVKEWWKNYESGRWIVEHAPFKNWKLEKIDPKTITPHHEGDEDNLEDVGTAKGPDELPPVVLTKNRKTIDGCHRSIVAKDKNWEYLWAWTPVPGSEMSAEEEKFLLDEQSPVDEIFKMIESWT